MSTGDAAMPRWRGARLDLPAVRRDAVLAGGFSGMNALAGTLDAAWIIPGALFGAVLGSVLHVLPAEPAPDDDWRSRVVVRSACGMVGGAWAGLGFAFVASGVAAGAASAPTPGELVPNILVGAITGLAWYLGWGLWETRRLRDPG